MSGNTVYSDYKIVDLDEYKKSSIHQKKQQELNVKKYDKKRKCSKIAPNKNIKLKNTKSNIGLFIAVIAVVFIICLLIAYFVNSSNLKAEINIISHMINI